MKWQDNLRHHLDIRISKEIEIWALKSSRSVLMIMNSKSSQISLLILPPPPPLIWAVFSSFFIVFSNRSDICFCSSSWSSLAHLGGLLVSFGQCCLRFSSFFLFVQTSASALSSLAHLGTYGTYLLELHTGGEDYERGALRWLRGRSESWKT